MFSFLFSAIRLTLPLDENSFPFAATTGLDGPLEGQTGAETAGGRNRRLVYPIVPGDGTFFASQKSNSFVHRLQESIAYLPTVRNRTDWLLIRCQDG